MKFFPFGAAEQREPLEVDFCEEAESLSQTEEEAVIYTTQSSTVQKLLACWIFRMFSAFVHFGLYKHKSIKWSDNLLWP